MVASGLELTTFVPFSEVQAVSREINNGVDRMVFSHRRGMFSIPSQTIDDTTQVGLTTQSHGLNRKGLLVTLRQLIVPLQLGNCVLLGSPLGDGEDTVRSVDGVKGEVRFETRGRGSG